MAEKKTQIEDISRNIYDIKNKDEYSYKSKKGIKHDYLFKGLLYCAECGARLNITY